MASNEPPNKMMKIEGEMETPPLFESKHINQLPPESLGQILCSGLSVIDRLHCSRVSRHWRWAVGEFAWTEQRKIDRDTVFEGITPENMDRYLERFWQIATPEDDCHLVSLLKRITIGPRNNLMELDLLSFRNINIEPFVPRIADSLKLIQKLEKLSIGYSDLANFVEYLPPNLRSLHSPAFSIQTLEMLSVRCPNLEEVPFRNVHYATLEMVNKYLPRFPRQTKLLFDHYFESDKGNLTAIAGLKELEVLELWDFECFDEESFEAMTKGCQKLKKLFDFNTAPLPEKSLFHLAKMRNLTVLEIGWDRNGAFTDDVLKAIARRGLLKGFGADSKELSDDSIIFLIERCKSLVSLDLSNCSKISDRSLEAVVSEVQRRHGTPPQALPFGPEDNEIFFFNGYETGIHIEKAQELAANHPWLTLWFDLTFETRELI